MPTLVEVAVPVQQLDESDDASETILYDDHSIDIFDGGERGERVERSPIEPKTVDESATILSDTLLGDDTVEERDEMAPARSGPARTNLSLSQTSRTSTGRRKPFERAHHNNIIGPNETLYRSKYESLVKSTIQEFDRKYPGKLLDYRSLTPEEQAKEQQRVLALLSRLGIGKGSQKKHPEHVASQRCRKNQSPASAMPIDRERLLNDTMSPLIMSPSCHGPPQMIDEENSFNMPYNDDHDDSEISQSLEYEQSRILLSPVPLQNDSKNHCPGHPHSKGEAQNLSSQSVEIVRAAALERSPHSITSTGYGSPDALKASNPYKRHASTSGSAHIYRTRYNEDVVPPRPDDESVSDHTMDGMEDESISARMERLSISPVDAGPTSFFAASQSPISPRLTYGSSDSSCGDDSVNANKGSKPRRGESTSTQFCDETIETSATVDNKTVRRAMREIPVNVGMKKGHTFHLEKLDIKRSELTRREKKNGIGGTITRRRLINFPDPLSQYNSKPKKVLNEVFELLRRSELDSRDQTIVETTSANVLFSLSYHQIMDLCLKLCLKDEEENHCSGRNTIRTPLPMQGRTLIIARTNDDISTWERALREGTGCSVFNHAAAPLSERVRLSTAEKATKYDVVLTTYDALKSSDMAIPMDDFGYAIVSKPKLDNGWMASRSASISHADSAVCPQKCKQLCVLHKVNFRRAIFVDILGRKSFLAKNGTARADASIALRANSRLVFFCRSEVDGDSAYRALEKSDRRATESLSAILHLRPRTESEGTDHDNSYDQEVKENDGLDPLQNCALDLKQLLI